MTAINAEQIDVTLRKVARARNVVTKADALKQGDSEILRKVLTYTYSPYIRFGIKLSATDALHLQSAGISGGLDIDDPDIWTLLDDFKSSTEHTTNKLHRLKELAKRCDPQTLVLVTGIIDKSVVTGISASTVNKAFPDLIPVFSVQLANKYTDKRIKAFPQYVEVKYDGIRATGVIHPSGDVEVLTRTGRQIPAAKYFIDELRLIGTAYKMAIALPSGVAYEGCVTDGEICGDSFNDTVSTFRSNEVADSGTYQVFDILPMAALTDKTHVSKTFEERRKDLEKVMLTVNGVGAPLTKVVMSQAYIARSKEEIWSMYYKVRELGMEGVIVKDPKGIWQRKRSNDWLKIKAEETADLVVVGAFEGEGEMEGTLGGIIVDFKGTHVRVGSGFTHEDRDRLWTMFLSDLQKSEDGDTNFELIGFLAEVQYQEITPDGSLRHPVFVRMRRDKEEVSF